MITKRKKKQLPPIKVWPWRAAPQRYKRLGNFGGDEDWVILVPNWCAKDPLVELQFLGVGSENYLPNWGYIQKDVVKEGIVVIVGHA